MTRYRELTVAGGPREMGRQIGEATRAEIREFAAVALELVNKSLPVSQAAADEIVAATLQSARQYSEDMFTELQGIAEGAGVTLEQIMLLQVRNQLQPAADAGCTSLSVAPASAGGYIVAQNWDNDPALQPFTMVLTRRPTGKPAIMTVTQAGLIAYIGLNDAGIGVCLNTLPAPARRFGVPHYFTVRGILESTSLAAAVHAVDRAERAIPANIMLATPQGPADLEVTVEHVHILREVEADGITHTNHCRAEALLPVNDQFSELIQSHSRLRRIDELMKLSHQRPAVTEIQAALRDHADYPRSICRHANHDPQTGHWETVFSVIIEPQSQQMHISRGPPCTQPYETYRLG